mgnify:CR=1 FL=1
MIPASALIFDAQYDAAEYNAHVGWGHGCVDDGVAVAMEPEDAAQLAERLRLPVTTADELLRMPSDGYRYELVAG